MTKEISFLLGSGFSVPENLPTVSAINRKLRNLKEDEFYLFSDQSAAFYQNEWRDPNGWMPGVYFDRLFAQEFIAFYCQNVLSSDLEAFNYEVFYDYFSDYLRFGKYKKEIDQFCNAFFDTHADHELWRIDNYNLVSKFSRIFNQLIADLLFIPKYFEDVTYMNYMNYDSLASFLSYAMESHAVNVHTLNHDIFFDTLGSKHVNLWQNFCDGFSDFGSPYFGEVSVDHKTDSKDIHKTYKVRLKRYTGVYNNSLRLFKLHGSIDNYILRYSDKIGSSLVNESIRVKKDYAVNHFVMERINEDKQTYFYDRAFTETFPDFLSGTTEKIRQYNEPFYENLFKHFKGNLLNSTQLFVIGYGFQDRGINEYLENHFLIYNKPMVVIDIRQPKNDLFDKYKEQITFLDKGAIGVSYTEYCALFDASNPKTL